MARRISTTATAMGVGAAGRDLLRAALEMAMAPRRRALADDHDPRFLHPGRCVVILLDDLKASDPDMLAAAALIETEDMAFRVDPDRIEALLGAGVADLVRAVPHPGEEALADALACAESVVRQLALVERLDHLRHAHLWTDMVRRREAHRVAVRTYLPVAEGSAEILARRYRWWCRMFGKRYLAQV